jgi:hypothetical protein
MDRLIRIAARGGQALLIGSLIASLGCRSMKSEIPPGKPYSTTGAPTPNVGFSSDARPDPSGAGGLYGGIQQTGGDGLPQPGVQQAGGPSTPLGAAGGQPQYGTPIGNKNSYTEALPAQGRYGPPGSTGLPSPTANPMDPPPAASYPSMLPGQTQAPAQSRQTETPLKGALGVDLP